MSSSTHSWPTRQALRSSNAFDRLARRDRRYPRLTAVGGKFSAVLRRYRAGVPWRDLAQRFGDWTTMKRVFGRLARSGAFQRIFKMLASHHENEYMTIDASTLLD